MTQPRVRVDFSAAERMLSVLPYVRRREAPPAELVDQLIATPGIQAWFRHMSRFGPERGEDWYRGVISRATAASDAGKVDWHTGKLRAGADREQELRLILEAVKALDFQELCERAYDAANANLDIPYATPVDVSLACATRGSAIVIDNGIVWDIADFRDPAVSPLPLDLIGATLAHEIFHLGRDAQEKVLLPPRNRSDAFWAFQLLGMLVEEGAATYLYTEEFAPIFNGQPWFTALADLPAVVERVSAAFRAGLSAPADDAGLRERVLGFFGEEGYVLGSESCRIIDATLGREALRRVLRDRRVLPRLHNEAVERGGLAMPRFADDVVEASEAL